MSGPETYVTANSQTLFLPQPLLDGLHTTCYHESGIWRIFRLSDATAPVAQWIEHLTSNLVAVGSSPAGRARVHGPLPNVHLFSVYSLVRLIVGTRLLFQHDRQAHLIHIRTIDGKILNLSSIVPSRVCCSAPFV